MWKGIPNRGGTETERALSKRLCVNTGNLQDMTVSRGAESSGGCVGVYEIRKVFGTERVDCTITEASNFELDSGFNRKPVQFIQVGRHMVSSWNSEN